MNMMTMLLFKRYMIFEEERNPVLLSFLTIKNRKPFLLIEF
jgi:hypothetical protein